MKRGCRHERIAQTQTCSPYLIVEAWNLKYLILAKEVKEEPAVALLRALLKHNTS